MRWKFLSFPVAAILSCALVALSLFAPQTHALAFFGRSEKTSARPWLVGYFPQWGLYDDQPYLVKDLVANGGARLLDQINYAQAFVTDGRCSIADPNADLGNAFSAENSVSGVADDPASNFRGYFHQLQELKRRYPHIKILISLEGKAASFADDARPENRQAFVASCVDRFLRGNFAPGIHAAGIFDGFDIDWEFPGSNDGHLGNHVSVHDSANFTLLLNEFRTELDALGGKHYELTAALPAGPSEIKDIQVSQIASDLDLGDLEGYDFHGAFETNGPTDFQAPVYDTTDSPSFGTGFTVDDATNSYLQAGFPASKLTLGVAFYGRGWTGVPAGSADGLYQPATGPTAAFPFSQQPGVADYKELEAAGELDDNTFFDPDTQTSFVYDGTNFFTVETPQSLAYKDQYIAAKGLAGIMMYSLEADDAQASLFHAAINAPND